MVANDHEAFSKPHEYIHFLETTVKEQSAEIRHFIARLSAFKESRLTFRGNVVRLRSSLEVKDIILAKKVVEVLTLLLSKESDHLNHLSLEDPEWHEKE
jgi:hypothetical protein